MTLTRRQMCTSLGLSGVGVALSVRHVALQARTQAPAGAEGPFALPALPYPIAALEPHIDAETMQLHHDRHHRAYVANLNTAVANAGAAGRMPLEEMLKNLNQVPDAARTAIRNNGGGHWAHTQFWTAMAPNAGGTPTGAIAEAVASTFGSLDTFKEIFTATAAGRFGSGWVWLSDDHGRLVIHSTPNQDTPSMENKRGIFGLDVWEHAYYLKYRNRRADYVTAFWNVIDWGEINRRLRG